MIKKDDNFWRRPLIVPIETNTVTAMAVHGALCLALRHPHFNGEGDHGHGESRKLVVEFTKSLGDWLVRSGAMTEGQMRFAQRIEDEAGSSDLEG